jgi:hypothetical protein
MNTKSMGIALLSAAALLGGTAAQAELSWTYGEFGYTRADGVEDQQTDAYDIKGSIGFGGNWHASLDYLDGTSENGTGNQDTDFDGWSLVVGAHPQLTTNTQLIADLNYFNYDVDGGEGTDGYGLGLGLRHSLSDKVELMAEVWYTEGTIDNNSPFSPDVDYNNTAIEFGARYNWTPSLSTGLTVNLDGGAGAATSSSSSSSDAARFDVRWSFLGAVSDAMSPSDSY